MNQLIVISAVGPDRPGVVHELTRVVLDCGGNILESRMAALGSEFAMLLLVSGSWHTPAKLETALDKLAEANGLAVTVRQTRQKEPSRDRLPYAVDVVCLDQAGIVYNLANFFTSRDIDIAELTTRSYAAAHTGAPMFAVQMNISIPQDVQISVLREDFMEFCDQLNLDAIIEPVKT
jgi:glycine cleavage system transcriptional repressor